MQPFALSGLPDANATHPSHAISGYCAVLIDSDAGGYGLVDVSY